VKTLTAVVLIAILAGCSSLTPVNDPVYLRIQDVEARLIRIEKVLDNQSLISLATDVSSLRTEVQSLRGDIETLQHNLEQQGSQNRDLYVDLDQRMVKLETAQKNLQSLPAGPSGAPISDQAAYDAAFALTSQRKFEEAQKAFESFLAAYPQSALRSNAQYWLGETKYGQLEFGDALREFQKVVDQYPDSSKLPDALVKIGYCNDELGKPDAARQALSRVVREFPGTQAANLAEQRLAKIGR
jgi:tol-pal system protein YbgF